MNQQKGITLIALVITIIILLILAGISIVALVGENGILNKAIKAAQASKIADYTERIDLIVAEEIAERLEKPKEELLIKSLKEKIKEQDWVEEVFMTDNGGTETTEETEGTHLIVETKDGYELIVEVNNVELWAKVVEAGKAKKEKHKVTYIEEGKKEKVEVRQGFSITLKKCETTKEGYQFTGWCESEKGEGERFAQGSLYKPTKDTKLYAIFEEKTVTIHFDANEGEGNLEDISVKQGKEIQLPSNSTITRTGYRFTGWNTKQDGSGTFYKDNATITTTEDMTLYAMWEENIIATVSITNKKITEGTTVNLSAIAVNNIEKAELKVGNVTLYSENNIGETTYTKNNISLQALENLGQLVFYDDLTVTLEITTVVGTKGSANLTQVKNYTVSTDTQLIKLASVVNSGNTLEGEAIIQLADIDVNKGKWTANSDGTVSFKSGATQWPVIGMADYDYDSRISTQRKTFKGIYDGKNYKIEGVYINNTSRDMVGLFGVNVGTIKNINLRNSIIKGRYIAGGLAAENEGKIENCINYTNVSGGWNIGGICATNLGELINDINWGSISGSYNEGWKSSRIQAGGIAGWSGNSISKCRNYGTISSTSKVEEAGAVGGLVGVASSQVNISTSANSGKIISPSDEKYFGGGILGFSPSWGVTFVTISQCYNEGTISGNNVAGIVEWADHMKIQDCYNKGTVQGSSRMGGITTWVGQSDKYDGSIINCYNVGAVSGNTINTGGIIGIYSSNPTITNCYNLNTSSTYAVGTGTGGWGTLENVWAGHVETKDVAGMKGLAGVLGSNWTNDTKNINKGYPILKWQVAN